MTRNDTIKRTASQIRRGDVVRIAAGRTTNVYRVEHVVRHATRVVIFARIPGMPTRRRFVYVSDEFLTVEAGE